MPLNILSKVRVVAEFVGDGRLWSVAWQDDGLGGQFCQHVGKAVHQGFVAAALEVGTPYAHAEEGVAREGDMLFGAVEHHAAGGVARRLEHL